MRIAMVSPYDWCVDGGVKSHIVHLAAYFRQWGHDVTIFAPASEPEKVGDECVVMGKPRSMRVSGSVARITFSWKSPEVSTLLVCSTYLVCSTAQIRITQHCSHNRLQARHQLVAAPR